MTDKNSQDKPKEAYWQSNPKITITAKRSGQWISNNKIKIEISETKKDSE
jgi:hypothetical protein